MPFPSYHQKETAEAFAHPRVGDSFHEMFAFWVIVVGVFPREIITLEINPPGELPKDGEAHRYTPQEFRKHFSYGTSPGYWVTWEHLARYVDDEWLAVARKKLQTAT